MLDEVSSTTKCLRGLYNYPLDDFGALACSYGTPCRDVGLEGGARSRGCTGEYGRNLVHMPWTRLEYIASDTRLYNQCITNLDSSRAPRLFSWKHVQSLDEAIGCLREALNNCSPDLDQVSFDLASLLALLFLVHHVDNDYKDAKVLLDRIAVPRGPSVCMSFPSHDTDLRA